MIPLYLRSSIVTSSLIYLVDHSVVLPLSATGVHHFPGYPSRPSISFQTISTLSFPLSSLCPFFPFPLFVPHWEMVLFTGGPVSGECDNKQCAKLIQTNNRRGLVSWQKKEKQSWVNNCNGNMWTFPLILNFFKECVDTTVAFFFSRNSRLNRE